MPKKVLLSVVFLSVFVVGMNLWFLPSNILSWDVFGYYLYLPFTFIYHDLGLINHDVIVDIIDKYNNTGTFYQALKMSDEVWVMKYSMGMSVMYAPFFFIGWVIALILDYPIDGFSAPFQYAIFSGGIIYSLIGLWFTTKVLNRFFSELVTILSLILIVLATNYLVHVTMYGQNAMSQNYLFTGYALVLWLTIRWHESYKLKYMVLIAVVSGLMMLSRPTEIVVLLIPVLWSIASKETFVTKLNLLWKYKTQVILFAVIVGLIGSSQLIYWKVYAGKFLFNSYGANAGEGLDLFSPYTSQFLFSFRKGWLIYTPIMLLAITGFYIMFKKNRAVFFALFGYFVVNLWFVSSWSNWWYAQSFSQRAMVSSYPIMAISLGYFLSWLFEQNQGVKYLGTGILISMLGLNIFQVVQFEKRVLHGDRMTKEYYFATFGKLSVSEADKKLLLVNRVFDGVEVFNDEKDYAKTNTIVLNFDSFSGTKNNKAHSGCCVVVLDSSTKCSPFIEMPYNVITQQDHAWIRVWANVFPTQTDISYNAFSLVMRFMYGGFAYKHKAFDANKMNLIPNQWNKISFDYLTPEVRTKTDLFRTMIWYRGNDTLLLDDLKVEVFERK